MATLRDTSLKHWAVMTDPRTNGSGGGHSALAAREEDNTRLDALLDRIHQLTAAQGPPPRRPAPEPTPEPPRDPSREPPRDSSRNPPAASSGKADVWVPV